MDSNKIVLKLIRDTIPDLIFYKDTNGLYLGCNPSFEKFAGCAEDDLIGKTDMEIFKIDAEMAALFMEADRRIMSRKATESIEELITYPDGTAKYVETVKTPFIENGVVVGILGISRDISARKEKERLEMEADEYSRLMLDSSPLACDVWDENFTMIDCNQAALKLFDMPTKADYCKNFYRMSVPVQENGRSSHELIEEYVLSALAQDSQFTFKWMHCKLDGTLIPAEVTLKKVDYKNSFRILGYIRDLRKEIAAQEAVREADERNQIMIDATHICFTFWDDTFTMVDCNEASLRFFSVSEKETILKNFFQFSPEFQPDGIKTEEKHRFVMQKCLDEGKYAFEWMHQNSAMELIPSEITLVKVAYKGEVRIAGYARDLREYKAMLAEIEKSRKAAEDSARAKSQFLANMSHEIRTPMNAIIGMTNIGLSTQDPQKKQYCLSKVNDASRHLLVLINDILDMSKIEAEKFVLVREPFYLEKVIENICDVVNVRASEKKINLSANMDINVLRWFIGDEFRLSQVITNILSNAIKFTPEFGNVTLNIHLESEYDKKSRITFNVTDTGIGIAEEQIAKLFTSFEQAEASITRRFGGTGLGLAISKRIVEMMGGKIGVTSEPGKGSRFSFTIELEWDEGAHDDDTGHCFPVYRDLKLLIVDDDRAAVEYFSQVMERFGIQCDSAISSHDAFELARKTVNSGEIYNIVFVDYHIDELNGIETVRKLQEILGEAIGVVMISATDWVDVETKAEGTNISRFVQKPLFSSTIFNAINEIIFNNKLFKRITPDTAQSRTFSGCSMLLVEDIEINREIVISLLENTKIHIDCAENGEQAVCMFEEHPEKYDIILMDVQMPVMDGLTATRHIRSCDKPRAGTVPIMAMTANAFKEDVEACRAAGMTDHTSKPIDVKELIDKLGKHLKGREDGTQ